MCMDCVYGLRGVRIWVGLRTCPRISYDPWRRKLGQHDSTAQRNPESTPARVSPLPQPQPKATVSFRTEGKLCSLPSGFPSLQGSGPLRLTLLHVLGCLLTLLWFSHQEHGEAQSGRGRSRRVLWRGCSEM